MRSRRSGRAPETAWSAAPLSVCGGSCETPRTIELHSEDGVSGEHAERERADARARSIEPRQQQRVHERLRPRHREQRAQGRPRPFRRRRLEVDAEILRHIAAEQRDDGAGAGSRAPSSLWGLGTGVRRLRHAHLTSGVAPPATATGAEGATLSFRKPSNSSSRPIEVGLGPAFGQLVGGRDLGQRQRLKAELRIGERLQAVRTREMSVFGAQQIDRVLLPGDQMARLHELLGSVDRPVLDAVDVSRRSDQRRDGGSMQEPPNHLCLPRRAGGCVNAKIASSVAFAGASRRTA